MDRLTLPIMPSIAGVTLLSALDFVRPTGFKGFVAGYSGSPVVVAADEITGNLRRRGNFALAELLVDVKPHTYVGDFTIVGEPWYNQKPLMNTLDAVFSDRRIKFAVDTANWANIFSAHERYASGLTGSLSVCVCSRNANHVWIEGDTKTAGYCDYDGAQLNCS